MQARSLSGMGGARLQLSVLLLGLCFSCIHGFTAPGVLPFRPVVHPAVSYVAPASSWTKGTTGFHNSLRKTDGPSLRAHTSQGLQLNMCAGGAITSFMHSVGSSLPHTWLTTLGTPSANIVFQCMFLATNLAYFWAAFEILRQRSHPKFVMATSMTMCGFISTIFHGHQCFMGAKCAVTHAWCCLDSFFAGSTIILFALTCRKAMLPPSKTQMFGWAAALTLFWHAGPYYTVTHGLWHVATAFLAYSIVAERDEKAGVPPRRRPLFGFPKRSQLPNIGQGLTSILGLKQNPMKVANDAKRLESS